MVRSSSDSYVSPAHNVEPVARTIQSEMARQGFEAAAFEFTRRWAFEYNPHERAFLERHWLGAVR